MLSRLLILAATSLLFVAPSLGGQLKVGPKAVVELFTSQGCSSCPKADMMLEELAHRPDLVTLAYHVDYWDYIGWRDTFGAREYSDRQRAYAESLGSGRIFTPQVVVNGTGGVVGSRRPAVDEALEVAALPLNVSLNEAPHDMLKVAVDANEALPGAAIWLVTFLDRADVDIQRGENEGRKIAYSHIVTKRQVLGMWNPEAGAELTLPLSEILTGPSNGAVILVQEDRNGLPGPILGAASFSR